MSMNLYDTLGIDKTATQSEIKSAYRKKATEHHPDKNGGKESEEFHNVQLAYEVLSDPEERKQYDETGRYSNDPEWKKIRDRFYETLASVMFDITDSQDILEVVKSLIRNKIGQKQSEIMNYRDKLKRVSKIIKRIKPKGSEDYLITALQNEIKMGNELIKSAEQHVEFLKKVVEYGDHYESSEPIIRGLIGSGFFVSMKPGFKYEIGS